MVYFTADTHFFHSNVIRLCKRPFHDLDDMTEKLIFNWNNVVTDKDEIYILGDFSFKGKANEVNDILKKLKGKKYLIKGNHDKYIDDKDFDGSHFEWVKDYFELFYKDKQFMLFHYPILEWNGFFRDKAIHLYGHVHNSVITNINQKRRFDVLDGNRAFNVGVDMNNYAPVSADYIISLFENL